MEMVVVGQQSLESPVVDVHFQGASVDLIGRDVEGVPHGLGELRPDVFAFVSNSRQVESTAAVVRVRESFKCGCEEVRMCAVE